MAFAYTTTLRQVVGSCRLTAGTFTNGASDSGGAIDSGLKSIDFASVSCNSHLGTEFVKVTWSAGTVTLLTTEGADGTWMAIGRV